ncbi:LysR family transcriptional regulator [Sphingomonas sp. RT2P30]|uniref:LysR family transcriptional regulator n=1 Tax=Parasphingomonas halimpatiens TaxID=3096162 RepID=UPI002FC5FBA9
MSDLPNLKSLDLNLLIVFDAVYTARSISRAADRLGMTQGAVSNALGRLRDRVGDPLFARSQHGVSPTLKAAQMVGPIREALATIDRQLADAPFDLQHYRRHFRIMIGDLFEPIMLPPLLRKIATAAPHVTVESASHLRLDVVKALRSGSTDLAAFLYPIDAPDMHVEPLCRIEHLVVARRGHPEIGETLDAETFARLGHVVLEAELRDRLAIEQNLFSEGIAR